jgi:tRNA/rRNA methyltransferase
MSFHTYMLRCADGSYYVGHTDDLEQRLAQHRSGGIEGFTAKRLPVELVWSGDAPTREDAFAFERKLKGWSRDKKEALIAGDWDRISRLAREPRTSDDKPTAAPPPPAIVLVRPQLGQNIGKAARAMLNFGLTELRLVAPRDGWPNPEAGPAASGADRVLAGATVFDSVADATADCTHVYATTVRRRGITKPVVTPEQAARTIRSEPGRAAILFGPERSGLESDDVAVARTIVTVPINPKFGSLNLAQAVILVAYEWSRGEALAQPPVVDILPPAPQEELDGMIAQMDAMLVEAGFFFPPDRTPVTRRMLRTLLTKPGWDAQEVRTMRGVLSAFAKPQRR